MHVLYSLNIVSNGWPYLGIRVYIFCLRFAFISRIVLGTTNTIDFLKSATECIISIHCIALLKLLSSIDR